MSNEHLRGFTINHLRRGAAAYEAYCDALDWKSYRGDPLPTWAELSADPARIGIVTGWIKAADKITDISPLVRGEECLLLKYLPANQAPPPKAQFFFVPVEREAACTQWNCDTEVLAGIAEHQTTKKPLETALLSFLHRHDGGDDLQKVYTTYPVNIVSTHAGNFLVTCNAAPSLTVTRIPGGVFVHASGIHVESLTPDELLARSQAL